MESWDGASDEVLLESSAASPEAFGAFYRRYEERVVRYFLRRVREPDLAADLTAETFAAALASSKRFRRRREPADAWLFGIARKVLAMSRRRGTIDARARRRLGMPVLVVTDEALERIAQLDGEAMDLMEELPPAHREAVRARVVDELGYPEVAARLRCSEALARQRVSRGLRELRERMEGTWH
jgi:RNA polymerase sigma factor (sigma-70 family)